MTTTSLTTMTFVIVFFGGFMIFTMHSYTDNKIILQWLPLSEEVHNADFSTIRSSLAPSKIENYKTILNLAYDWKNFWLLFRSTLKQNETSRISSKTIDDAFRINNVRLYDLLGESTKERKSLLDDLAEAIANRIDELQNPPDCDQVVKHAMDISRSSCGLGCTLHSVVFGLLDAFMSNHTFVLHSEGWKYAGEGWEYAFLPLSNCTAPNKETMKRAEDTENMKYINSGGTPDWIRWRVPGRVEALLKKLHGDPFAWWMSQFVRYVLRLQPFLQKRFNDFGRKIGFNESTVGIHVRWGDKLNTESKKFEVEDYMMFVENWFLQREHHGDVVERVVFVASQQTEAWNELTSKYKNYKFIGNIPSKSIIKQRERFNHDNLESALLDIHFLSKCSYVVCALSSHIARTVYELMMNTHDEPSTRIHNLDILYRLKGGGQPVWEAIMDHNPTGPGEIAFKIGDRFAITTDWRFEYNNGYLKGRNLRTKKSGKVPIFKIREKVLPYDEKEVPKLWLPIPLPHI